MSTNQAELQRNLLTSPRLTGQDQIQPEQALKDQEEAQNSPLSTKQNLMSTDPVEQPTNMTHLQAPVSPTLPSLSLKYKPEKRRDGPYVKKPPNAFMMFVKEQRETIKAQHVGIDNATVLTILGEKWRSMTKEQQAKYYDQAVEEKRLHSQLHPDWSFRDSYGKKKKTARKRSNSHFTSEGPEVPQDRKRKRPDPTEETGDEDSPSPFTLFSTKQKSAVTDAFTTRNDSNMIEKILKEQWKKLSKKEKVTYYKQAYDLKCDSKQQQPDCVSDDREVTAESSTVTEECPLDLSQPKRRAHPVYDGMPEVQNVSVQMETQGAVRNHPPTQSETMQPWMYANDTLPSTNSLTMQQPRQPVAKIRRSEPEKRRDGPHVKKPPNAFMMFVKEQRETIQTQYKVTDNAMVLQILGEKWRSMTKEQQAKYYDQAEEEKRLHSQLHPDWSFRDSYGSKRPRKRVKPSTDIQECPEGLSQPKRPCTHPVYDGTAEVQNVTVETETQGAVRNHPQTQVAVRNHPQTQGAVRNHPPAQTETMQPWMEASVTLPSTNSSTRQQPTQPVAKIRRSEPEKRRDGPHIKKPPNAFMMFVKEQRETIQEQYKVTDNAMVLQILGEKWRSMTKEQQAKYYDQAEEEKRLHSQLHPDWSFRDSYGSKRPRKRVKPSTDIQDHSEDLPQPKRCRLQPEYDGMSEAQNVTVETETQGAESNHPPTQSETMQPCMHTNVTLPSTDSLTMQQPSRPSVTQQPSRPSVTQQPSQPDVTQQPSRPSVTQQPSRPSVTQQPSRPSVTQQPSRPSVTQQPSRLSVTQQPSRLSVTQQPSRPSVTQQPSQPDVKQQPSQPDVTQQPSQPDVTQQPSRPSVTQQPSRLSVTQQPSRPDVTHEPSRPDVTQQPSRPDVTQQPSRPDVTQQPSRASVTQQPSRLSVTQQPSRPDVTQQPSRPSVTQQPSRPSVTQQPSRPSVTQQPSRPSVTQQPSRPSVTQQPSRADVTQQPSRPDVTQQPSRPDVTQQPSRPGVTQEPSRPDVTQQPSRPSVTQQPSRPSVTQQPSRAAVTQQPSRPDVTQQPSRPSVTQQPSRPSVTQQPSRAAVTQQPSRPDVTQQPSRPDVTQQPSRPSVTQQPSRAAVTQQPSRPDVTQQPSRPSVTQQPSRPSVIQQPSRPEAMQQGMYSFIMQQQTWITVIQQETHTNVIQESRSIVMMQPHTQPF